MAGQPAEQLPAATVQLAELLRHPAIENRFAMGWMPTDTMFSHGLRSKCADLAELLLLNNRSAGSVQFFSCTDPADLLIFLFYFRSFPTAFCFALWRMIALCLFTTATIPSTNRFRYLRTGSVATEKTTSSITHFWDIPEMANN